MPSFYLPSNFVLDCSEKLENGLSFGEHDSCRQLNQLIKQILDSNLFNDIGFDYRGLKAIEASSYSTYFKWNTWNLEAKDLINIHKDRFRMVILNNNDPNNL